MPRVLSSSEDEEEDNEEFVVPDLGRMRISNSPPQPPNPASFFNFGGSDEHQSIRQYVQQMVQEPFDHSTDSETDVDDDDLPELR